jgi:hypothetical protein
MNAYKLVVLSRPVDGRDDEYNDWYTNQHLGDVLKVPGFASAQRFKIKGDPVAGEAWDYLAVYEIDHENPKSVLDELGKRAGGEQMPMSPALSSELYCVLYEPITDKVTG